AHEISKHGCEVRLILESDSQCDIYKLCFALAEKLFGSIDAFLQNELMWRQSGAELEQLREMRLAHLRDPAQHAYRQRGSKIVPDVLDHTRETTRRNAKCLLVRNVGGSNKGARQFPCEIVRHDRCSHHQKIHAVILNAAPRRVRIVAKSRPYSRPLV